MTHPAKIALVGNPNVGKSAIFGYLTGRYATVSNYPGTTVEVSRGRAKLGGADCEVIDTPGLYSVYPVTEEERVTLNLLIREKPDIVVHVIDAKNMERSLAMTLELGEMGFNLAVSLNMFDEALALGMSISTMQLAERLRLPVVATVAIDGRGMDQLIETIKSLLCKCGDAKPDFKAPAFSEKKMREWHALSRKIAGQFVVKTGKKRALSKLDGIIINPITGIPILAVILYFGLYKFVGSLGAGVVVDFLDGGFESHINPWMEKIVSTVIPSKIFQTLFVGEYGILTLALRYAVAIILPIVGFFFFAFAIIEDSGYLPRLALLLDRAFKKIGLSGKAVIPMVLGLGCDTMATMVTRTLPTKRERFIATLLLALCIPCSAQLGVILGLLGQTPSVLLAWVVIMAAVFAFVGFALAKFVPGTRPAFIIEIPPMRFPQFKNVIIKTYMRMKWYFKEIIPLFAAASVIIWLLNSFGIFDLITRAMAGPLAAMGLPESSAVAFLFGFFRRDYGAAGLYDLHGAGAFTNNQLLIATVALTLFLPCITQFLITIKERGLKTGLGISVFVLCFAFAAGCVLNFAFAALGINF